MASSNTFTTQYVDILLTEDGDLDLTTSSVQLTTTNTLSLKQRPNLRLAIWEQEWKYYVEYGTPWRSYLSLGIAQAKSAIDQEVKRQIKKEVDVINIYNFVSTLSGRFYSCSMGILTEEGTFDFAVNLKDDFTYQIPSYSIGCDKIVEYQYWSSAPYDYIIRDAVYLGSYPDKGSLLDPVKNSEYISVSSSVLDFGELKDIVWTLDQPNDDRLNGDNDIALLGITMTSMSPQVTQINEDHLNGDNIVSLQSISLAVTIKYTTQDQPNEDRLNGDNAISLQSVTLVKTL